MDTWGERCNFDFSSQWDVQENTYTESTVKFVKKKKEVHTLYYVWTKFYDRLILDSA